MAKTISSPLVSSFNSIASLGGNTKRNLTKMQSEYKAFSTLLVKETKALEVIKLPPKRKIKKIANLKIAKKFGKICNICKIGKNWQKQVTSFPIDFLIRTSSKVPIQQY